jgi:hypothetical protein
MYDLLNLQIAEAASATRKPVFEVAEITDNYLLLIDLRLSGRGNINQYPAYVVSLLSRLCVLEGRRIFFNGVDDKLFELSHVSGKFEWRMLCSENKIIENRMFELMQSFPDLTPYNKITKSGIIYISSTTKRIIDYINDYILFKSKNSNAIFIVCEYADEYICIYYKQNMQRTLALNDAEWIIATLDETGYFEKRRLFVRNSFAPISEIKHRDGIFLKIIETDKLPS